MKKKHLIYIYNQKGGFMTKIIITLKMIVCLLTSFLGALLKFINEGIKPITDETKTNKGKVRRNKK